MQISMNVSKAMNACTFARILKDRIHVPATPTSLFIQTIQETVYVSSYRSYTCHYLYISSIYIYIYIYIYTIYIRRANARNVRPHYPHWQYTDLFIFRFVSILCLRSTLRLCKLMLCVIILQTGRVTGRARKRFLL